MYTKPQTVHLWAPPLNYISNVHWSGWKNISIEVQRTSLGAAADSPSSGFAYLEEEDSLIVSLLDGTLHVIRDISTEPVLKAHKADDMEVDQPITPYSRNSLDSQSLSQVMREAFVKQENRDVPIEVIGKLAGFTMFDRFGSLVWLTEYVLQRLKCELRLTR